LGVRIHMGIAVQPYGRSLATVTESQMTDP